MHSGKARYQVFEYFITWSIFDNSCCLFVCLCLCNSRNVDRLDIIEKLGELLYNLVGLHGLLGEHSFASVGKMSRAFESLLELSNMFDQ